MQSVTIPTSLRREAPSVGRNYSTDEAAAVLRLKPNTLRAALCVKGHYLGIKPAKLANGRLLWDAAKVEALTSGEVA